LIMKKQIIAAAVAATMSAAALADISITGAAQVNYTNSDKEGATPDTNIFSQETSLKFVGKSGDTEVVIGLGGQAFDANDEDDTGAEVVGTDSFVDVEDIYMTTKIGDINIKSGTWDSGDNPLRDSNRNSGKIALSTKLGGIDLGYNGTSAGASADEFVIGTAVSGVNLKFTQRAAGETISASGEVAGVKVSYLGYQEDAANEDKTVVEVSTKIGDISVKAGKATADSSATIDGNSWMGDYEDAGASMTLTDGQDVTAFELSTAVAGNTVTFRTASVDDATSGGSAHDVDWNKLIVTRPLASGATLEVTYTDTDDAQANNDTTDIDVELRVAF